MAFLHKGALLFFFNGKNLWAFLHKGALLFFLTERTFVGPGLSPAIFLDP